MKRLRKFWRRLQLAAHLVHECFKIDTDRARYQSAKAERRNLNKLRQQRHAKQ